MSKPHIALVIEGTYPWYRGGVSEWVAQYLNAFPHYHFSIIQVATDQYLRGDLSDALYEVPAQVIDFNRIASPAYAQDWQTSTRNWFNKHFEQVEPTFASADIIHVANTGFAGLMGQQAAEILSKPLVLTEHALYWKEIEMGAVALECGYRVPQQKARKERMVQHFKEMARSIYRSADSVISVSQCNIPQQKQLGADNVTYIPNGVGEAWFVPEKQPEGGRSPVIGWVGRCAEMKNPLRFFDFVEAYLDQQPGTQFVMMICDAGEAELQQKVTLKAGAYDCLQLMVNEPAQNHINQLDALCITSHNESQPLVLFEALASKVLPIGWAAGDVGAKYGLIVPDGTAEKELAQQVQALWQNADKWQCEVNKRYKKVRTNHTWPVIFEKYRRLFEPFMQSSAVYE